MTLKEIVEKLQAIRDMCDKALVLTFSFTNLGFLQKKLLTKFLAKFYVKYALFLV